MYARGRSPPSQLNRKDARGEVLLLAAAAPGERSGFLQPSHESHRKREDVRHTLIAEPLWGRHCFERHG